MKAAITLATLLLIALITATAAGAQEPETMQERLQAKVYDWTAAMITSRHKIILEGYTVLIDGIIISPHTLHVDTSGPGEPKASFIDVPSEFPFQKIYTRRGPGHAFDYRAMCGFFAMPSWSNERDLQRHQWFECLLSSAGDRDRQLIVQGGNRRARPWIPRPTGETRGYWYLEHHGNKLPGFTPYDSFVDGSFFFLARPDTRPIPIEESMYKIADLQKIEPTLGGRYKSTWKRQLDNGTSFTHTITHDPAAGWMPVETHLQNNKENWPVTGVAAEDSYSHLKMLRWSKQHGYWLPELIETTSQGYHSGKVKDTKTVMKLRWAVGDEVPAAAYEGDDLRAATMKHFDAEFMEIVSGHLTAAPFYQSPADLVEEFRQ